MLAAVWARGVTLEEGFVHPPHTVQPEAWWWFSTYSFLTLETGPR